MLLSVLRKMAEDVLAWITFVHPADIVEMEAKRKQL